MQIKNSPQRYGLIAASLHWIVAILFLGAYATVYYRRWFTEKGTDINISVIQLHFAIGITIAVFVAVRVLYKIYDQTPKDVPGSKLEHLAAHSAHIMLYAVMIIMPITGYVGTGANTDFFGLFEIPQFRETALYQWLIIDKMGLTWETFEPPVDFIHKKGGAYFVWVLIAIHIAAALFHHFIRRDNTIRRMLPVKLKD